MTMEDKLVTVGEFETGFEAELVKVRLEEQGVEAVVVGEDLVANMPTIERIRIELQVFEQYAEKAAKIIEAIEQEKEQESDEQA
ncbi:MAG: hypothetical protein DRP66_01235 [Planctomycetota bacterium]|nr:MAG: hypothetical protein DRP66_01235 [Planctomycetota bacterium]